MPLSDELRAMLEAPLTGADVKTRQNKFTYIETWFAKKQANRIFGYDGWEYQVVNIDCIGSDAIQKVDDQGQVTEGWRVGYVATVQVTALMCTRSDVGYGDAVEYGQSAITCHELAAKEAVSDALKRALASYGDQFGLILYDKDRDRLEGETGRAAPKEKAKPRQQAPPPEPERKLNSETDAETITEVRTQFAELRRRDSSAKALKIYDGMGGAEGVPYWSTEDVTSALQQVNRILETLADISEPELPPSPDPNAEAIAAIQRTADGDDIPF